MNIYFGHASSFDFQTELYSPIQQSILASQHTFIFPHETGKIWTDLRIVLPELDFVFAEVSYPSIGLGIELAWAHASGVPIICFCRSGITPSTSLRVVCDDIRQYQSAEEMIDIIKSILV